MGTRNHNGTGAPRWIESLQTEPRTAAEFYGKLFGWDIEETTLLAPGGDQAEYYIARLGGRRVAGIGRAPRGIPSGWLIQIRVTDIDEVIARTEAAGGSCLVLPVNRGPEGHVAVLGDATGVPFGVRQTGEPGAEPVSDSGRWAMSSLHSSDPERALRFYGEVFGWESRRDPGEPFTRWLLEGRVMGLLTPAEGSAPQHWSINIAVRDADAIAAHATSMGGTALLPPFDTPGFRNTVIADPYGAVLACSAPDP